MAGVCQRTDRGRRGTLNARTEIQEIYMYFGSGILGTILVVVLIVYFIRRT